MLSTPAARQPGRCPSCQGLGQVGEPCVERICALRGYCYVPNAGPAGPAPSIDDDAVIGQRCGDYLLIGVLGSGGFGRVYRALQLPVMMPAAVKLLDMEGGPAGMAAIKLAKFEIEAQALARLSHPNIVRLFQYGQHRGAPFLAMELIENARNLWSEIELRAEESRPFLLDEVQTILLQVLAALEAAHEQQIVHRDIKPENVMLQSFAGHGLFVKVLDFGLAKFTEDRTATSMLLGTPAYMAYEQLMRGPLGPWTDLYSLGVLAFELMTGKRPYGGGSVQETLALKLDTSFDPWSRVAHLGFPEELRVFSTRALARESEARYANATEFRAALEQALRGLREAGELYTRISAGRIVEATPIPFVPIPESMPLPDSTRRLARPLKSDANAQTTAGESDPAPKPLTTAPTGAMPGVGVGVGAGAGVRRGRGRGRGRAGGRGRGRGRGRAWARGGRVRSGWCSGWCCSRPWGSRPGSSRARAPRRSRPASASPMVRRSVPRARRRSGRRRVRASRQTRRC